MENVKRECFCRLWLVRRSHTSWRERATQGTRVPGLPLLVANRDSRYGSWVEVPVVVLGTPVFRPLYGSAFVLILATTISSMTLGVQMLKGSLMQLGDDLEESSWATGGSWLYTFRRVILPILVPMLFTVGSVAFISAARNVALFGLCVGMKT